MLAWLERHQLMLLLAAMALLAAGLTLRALDAGGSRPQLVFQDGSSLPDGTPIRVQVAGAVHSPGVYDLQSGDRVIDAIAAAGGHLPAADVSSLNLARRLRDGEKLEVPGASPAASPALLSTGQRLDLNKATQAQLDQLPGIGEAYSRRIVDSRTVDGPFRSVDELVSRRVIPPATLERIRDLVFVAP